MVSPGVFRVEGCLSKTRKVAQLSALAPANICSRASRASLLEGEVRQLKVELEKAESECRSINDHFQTARSQLDELHTKIHQLMEKIWEMEADSQARKDE